MALWVFFSFSLFLTHPSKYGGHRISTKKCMLKIKLSKLNTFIDYNYGICNKSELTMREEGMALRPE